MSDTGSSSGREERRKSREKRMPGDGDCEHLGKKEDNGETRKRKG